MAGIGARLHRLGSVYSRTKRLLESGVMKYENRPLWYDVYEAFPPVREPVYHPDPEPNQFGLLEVKDDVSPIFYPEDWARGMFHANKLQRMNEYSMMTLTSLFPGDDKKNFLQKFILQYRAFEEARKDLNRQEIFELTVKHFETASLPSS